MDRDLLRSAASNMLGAVIAASSESDDFQARGAPVAVGGIDRYACRSVDGNAELMARFEQLVTAHVDRYPLMGELSTSRAESHPTHLLP
jgi:hypothetical protein